MTDTTVDIEQTDDGAGVVADAQAPKGDAADKAAPPSDKAAPEKADAKKPAEGDKAKADDKKSKDVLLSGDEDGDGGADVDYSYTVPDDLKDLGDPEVVAANVEAFKETAKELGLNQEQFQKLIEFDGRRTKQALEAQTNAYEERVKSWAEQARTDKFLGGDALKENIRIANLALEKIGDDDLKAILKQPSEKNPEGLGLGNHPAILRFFARVGQLYEDPKLILGTSTTKDEQQTLKRLYPTMFKDTG